MIVPRTGMEKFVYTLIAQLCVSLQVALPLWLIAAAYVKRFRPMVLQPSSGWFLYIVPGASHTQYWWDCPTIGDYDHTIQLYVFFFQEPL